MLISLMNILLCITTFVLVPALVLGVLNYCYYKLLIQGRIVYQNVWKNNLFEIGFSQIL